MEVGSHLLYPTIFPLSFPNAALATSPLDSRLKIAGMTPMVCTYFYTILQSRFHFLKYLIRYRRVWSSCRAGITLLLFKNQSPNILNRSL